jgi:hypothetical protein
LDLFARFEQQLDAYKSGQYNETQLRREFLDPFFKALGWDIDNVQGCAEAYKDVIHEDAIRMGSATKAPDYCFRIGGARKYFLEAKKPLLQLANFQNGNGSGKMCPRINGRCLFKTETLAGYGCHSVERQQRHRIEIGIHTSRQWNQRLEAASAAARQPRLCFLPRAGSRICGRLFLAWLPEARANARQQPQLLASEAQSQQAEGQSCFKAIAEFRLARVAVLGARPRQPRSDRQAIGFRIE